MILTSDNYYTVEADREYMSCSQYQDFLRCEAAAMAKIHGIYSPTATEALIVGNYFHTALEGDAAHKIFCDKHFEEIYKTKQDKKTGEIVVTGKYAPYVKADEMIEAAKNDPLIGSILSMPGENEYIMTGELFGMPWKVRFDKYINDNRTIIDYKTAADLGRTEYNPTTNSRESFLEYLGYMMRAAVYSEIEKQNAKSDDDPKFIIVAISKQDPPDKGVYILNHRQRYDYELETIKNNLERIRKVKSGQVKPKRCGKCEYCRSTKRLSRIVPYYYLSPGSYDNMEEEYDDIFATYLEVAQKTT